MSRRGGSTGWPRSVGGRSAPDTTWSGGWPGVGRTAARRRRGRRRRRRGRRQPRRAVRAARPATRRVAAGRPAPLGSPGPDGWSAARDSRRCSRRSPPTHRVTLDILGDGPAASGCAPSPMPPAPGAITLGRARRRPRRLPRPPRRRGRLRLPLARRGLPQGRPRCAWRSGCRSSPREPGRSPSWSTRTRRPDRATRAGGDPGGAGAACCATDRERRGRSTRRGLAFAAAHTRPAEAARLVAHWRGWWPDLPWER